MNLKGNTLTAVMDLILDYPAEHVAFIGFFMTDTSCQKKGVDKGNPQSFSFWKKCGFTVTDETQYIFMELTL